MLTEKKPTLTEIAGRINAHLKRFEADPKINVLSKTWKTRPFYHAGAVRAGSYVRVCYISYQHAAALTREEAERYLAALDAGNTDRHYEVFRAEKGATT